MKQNEGWMMKNWVNQQPNTWCLHLNLKWSHSSSNTHNSSTTTTTWHHGGSNGGTRFFSFTKCILGLRFRFERHRIQLPPGAIRITTTTHSVSTILLSYPTDSVSSFQEKVTKRNFFQKYSPPSFPPFSPVKLFIARKHLLLKCCFSFIWNL